MSSHLLECDGCGRAVSCSADDATKVPALCDACRVTKDNFVHCSDTLWGDDDDPSGVWECSLAKGHDGAHVDGDNGHTWVRR